MGFLQITYVVILLLISNSKARKVADSQELIKTGSSSELVTPHLY